MEGLLIPIGFFAAVFGIAYIFVSARNRERLAMIEKGVDASIFLRGGDTFKNRYKMIILNIALILMGVGLGITVAIFLYSATQEEAVYPASIFFFAGLGLLASFFLGKNLIEK